MSTREKLFKARLGMLALAEELEKISPPLACRSARISRSHCYEIKVAFEKYGAEGLAPRSRRRPRICFWPSARSSIDGPVGERRLGSFYATSWWRVVWFSSRAAFSIHRSR